MKLNAVLKIAALPAVLAISGLLWFLFASDVHDFSRKTSQEDRHAEIVNAKPLPRSAIQITIKPRRNSCITITRAEVDGDKLWAYFRNDCHVVAEFIEIKYSGFAPDGTIVSSARHYTEPRDLDPGQQAEYHEEFKDDQRIIRIEITALDYSSK